MAMRTLSQMGILDDSNLAYILNEAYFVLNPLSMSINEEDQKAFYFAAKAIDDAARAFDIREPNIGFPWNNFLMEMAPYFDDMAHLMEDKDAQVQGRYQSPEYAKLNEVGIILTRLFRSKGIGNVSLDTLLERHFNDVLRNTLYSKVMYANRIAELNTGSTPNSQ